MCVLYILNVQMLVNCTQTRALLLNAKNECHHINIFACFLPTHVCPSQNRAILLKDFQRHFLRRQRPRPVSIIFIFKLYFSSFTLGFPKTNLACNEQRGRLRETKKIFVSCVMFHKSSNVPTLCYEHRYVLQVI